MNKDIKIIDNFLNKNDFNNIRDEILSCNFPWYISEYSDYSKDKNPQLYHIFYLNNLPNSNYFKILQPVYDKLNIFSLFKVRLIATMKYDGTDNKFHTDLENIGLLKTCTTAVFYLNSNDGGTQFQFDNKIVKSEANRMLIFNSTLKHKTIKHKTDVPFRYVINLNYIGINNDT
jgi:hypothetical protein